MTNTPTIHLRAFATSDLAILRAWFTDSSINNRISAPDQHWLSHIGAAHVRCFTITDPGGEMIGFIQVDTEDDGTHWCDMMIAPAKQGQGHGSAALRALATFYAREEKSLCATVEPDNAASIACLTKCAFTKDSAVDPDGFHIYRNGKAVP